MFTLIPPPLNSCSQTPAGCGCFFTAGKWAVPDRVLASHWPAGAPLKHHYLNQVEEKSQRGDRRRAVSGASTASIALCICVFLVCLALLFAVAGEPRANTVSRAF